MNKQCRKEGPDFALLEVVQTEDEIILSKRWVLLPRPNTGADASEDEKWIDLQGINPGEIKWRLEAQA